MCIPSSPPYPGSHLNFLGLLVSMAMGTSGTQGPGTEGSWQPQCLLGTAWWDCHSVKSSSAHRGQCILYRVNLLISVFLLLSHLFSAVEVCCALQPPLLLTQFPPPNMKKLPWLLMMECSKTVPYLGLALVLWGPPLLDPLSPPPLLHLCLLLLFLLPPLLLPLHITSPPFLCPPIPSVLLSPPFFWLQALHSTWEMQGKIAVPPKDSCRMP